jgi:BlaI family transcriptional regulator, penicillinase repressor
MYQPSEAELDILQVIWASEPVNVRQVWERISQQKEVGYTTVLKQIQRMTAEGVLQKEVKDGVHWYRAAVQEATIKQQLASKLLNNAFGGSALQLMMHALGNEKADPEELRQIKAWLDQQIP